MDLLRHSVIITCPVTTVLLGAKEEGPGVGEGSVVLAAVPVQDTLIARSLLSRTVSIVHFTVLNHGAISFEVLRICWHRLRDSVEDAWLIHVVPSVVSVGGPNELIKRVQARVEANGVLVEVVDPDRIAGPALTFEVSDAIFLLDKDILHVLRG